MNNTILPTVEEVKNDPKKALSAIIPIFIELTRLQDSGEVDVDKIMDELMEENPVWKTALEIAFGPMPTEEEINALTQEFLKNDMDSPEPYMN